MAAVLASVPAGAASADGSGSLTVSPTAVAPGSTTDTLTFTYAAAAGGVSAGEVDVVVPSGWSAPSTTGTDPGFTTSTCGTVGVSGSTIQVTNVTLSGGATCSITYGSKASGGLGATAPASPAVSTFSAIEKSTAAGTLTALSSSPNVDVGTSPDGSGTLMVSPSSLTVSSTADTLTFTYTAAAEGVSGGEIEVVVPAGWPAPSTTGSAAGDTTSTCGTVAVSTMTIEVTGVNLAGGASCTITYGSRASGGPGLTAPSSATTATFSGLEKSSASGNLTPIAVSPQVTTTTSITQIYGSDAIGTSIAISQAEFANGSAKAVVLARSDFFSDALAGGPLAAAVGGPLLITPGAPISSTIDPRVLIEIQRVLPVGGTVYVLGGDLAISGTVDQQLGAAGYNVIREAGTDEFDTAVKIANQLGNRTTIFLATGLSFYDALSAVPAAISQNAEILLTNGSTQDLETALYMLQYTGDKVYAIGGPLAAYGADPNAIPVYGQDLFGTSAAVAATFFPGAKVFGAATSDDFPDALGGGVFMASGGRLGPVLLVPSTPPLPVPVATYLASLTMGTPGYVFGGPLAVPASVIGALQTATG
jgi:hypothetical protein